MAAGRLHMTHVMTCIYRWLKTRRAQAQFPANFISTFNLSSLIRKSQVEKVFSKWILRNFSHKSDKQREAIFLFHAVFNKKYQITDAWKHKPNISQRTTKMKTLLYNIIIELQHHNFTSFDLCISQR